MLVMVPIVFFANGLTNGDWLEAEFLPWWTYTVMITVTAKVPVSWPGKSGVKTQYPGLEGNLISMYGQS